MSDLPPIFEKNLSALNKRDPGLARRLCLAVSDDHVDVDGARYRLHRTWHPLGVEPELPEGDVFVFGVGLGEAVIAALNQGRDVVAWDRDPWLLRLLILRHQLHRPLASGRLRLALGADLLTVPRAGLKTWKHPLLAGIYRNAEEVLEQGLREKRALVAEGTLFVDDIADALRDDGYSVCSWLVASTSSE